MGNLQPEERTFFKRSWVISLEAFLLLQFLFIFMELTGWIPNLRDFDGKFFGNLAEILRVNKWFTFYETPHFNLFTVIFGIVLLGHGIIGGTRDLLHYIKKS